MEPEELVCKKCGATIQLPDPGFDKYTFTESKLSQYGRRRTRAILKHAWQAHREDFPSQFRTFTEFMRWIYTPEGLDWDHKQGLLAEAENILKGSGDD